MTEQYLHALLNQASSQIEEKALVPQASTPSNIIISADTEHPKKKRKGPKGPNPLSVKKKKVRIGIESAGLGDVQGQVKVGAKRRLDDNDDDSHENEKKKPTRKRRKKLKTQNEAITA